MKSETTKLTFKNLTHSNRPADIVIFQKDNIEGSNIYAWRLIHNCRFSYTKDFDFSKDIDLIIRNSYGNYQEFSNVQKGLFYTFSSENGILEKGESVCPETIEVQSRLNEGAITAALRRNQKLIYSKNEICPDEIVSFSVNEEIYVGRTDEAIKPGQILSEKWLSRFTTKLCLSGIISADLVLRGGGFGLKAGKYYFRLENIVRG